MASFPPVSRLDTKTPQAFLITENVPAAIILKTKSGLFEHAKFLAHLDKGGDTLVELLAGVGGRELHTDAGLALGHYRIVEARDVDTFLEQTVGIALRERRVVEHHGADGALGGLDVKAGSLHLVAEVVDILYQMVMDGVVFLEHLEHLETGADNGGSQRVGEEVRTAALAQHVDDFLAAGGETAEGATKRLAQCAGIDVYATIGIAQFAHAVTGSTYHASRVRLVDHDEGVVFLSEVADFVHRSHVAVHREYAVGTDDAEALGLSLLQTLLELSHVGVGIAVALGLAQAHTVDDRGVVMASSSVRKEPKRPPLASKQAA